MQHLSFLSLFSTHSLLTIRRIAAREIRTRIVGTVLGFAHYVITPLFYLAVYTWLFSSVFVSRWSGSVGDSYGDFALRVYAGLIVFQFFSEIVGRAPRLLFENPSYITKIAFPVHILVPASMAASLFATIISYIILLFAHIFLIGMLPISVFFVPLLWGALVLFVAGVAWCLAALGVYLRDLSQLVSTVLPALMFLTPIFYPMSAVPGALRYALWANPLTWFVGATRDAIMDGAIPSVATLAVLYALGLCSALVGHWLFERTKHGFADVV